MVKEENKNMQAFLKEYYNTYKKWGMKEEDIIYHLRRYSAQFFVSISLNSLKELINKWNKEHERRETKSNIWDR